MEKVELNLVALTQSESQQGSFVLILEDEAQTRRLPIIIGKTEAQAIALVLQKMEPERPQTHDLLQDIIQKMGGELVEVIISEVVGSRYFAQLVISQKKIGKTHTIDSRTSDAIALAVRFDCPIYTVYSVLDKVGFSPEDLGKKKITDTSIRTASLEELELLLEKALAEEDYENATKIRDEIGKRA